MYCKLTSCALFGVDGLIIDVEVDVDNGLPSFDIVGLPDSAVREAKDRVRSAIKNSGYLFPVKRITVNLAPADYKKEGAYYDLPIALGILCCTGIISEKSLENKMIIGELSLDGSIRALKGILPMISKAKEVKLKQCLVPTNNLSEAILIDTVSVIGVSSLLECVNYLKGKVTCDSNIKFTSKSCDNVSYENLDFADVKGQESAKRAIEIAAAGRHNIIIIGPPGSGKTMLAHRIITILPYLSKQELIDSNKIYSICNKYHKTFVLDYKRPFRSPHHTTTPTALIGGGSTPLPGEVSFAHNGVLFLDEFLEFNKKTLESLRQPLESHSVTISRVSACVTFPANFMLVAATNPCPCGFYPDTARCSCSANNIYNYRKRLSGPLLDRIDLHVETNSISYEKIKDRTSESSTKIRKRIKNANKIQNTRYKKEDFKYNSELPPNLVDMYCPIGQVEEKLISTAFETLNFSIRSYHKVIKMARTIADLDSSEFIKTKHLSEAIQYRILDKQYN